MILDYCPLAEAVYSETGAQVDFLSICPPSIRQDLKELYTSNILEKVCIGTVMWEGVNSSLNAQYIPSTRRFSLEVVPCFSTSFIPDSIRQEALQPLFHALNNTSIEVMVLSPDFKYLYVNPASVKDPEMRKWLVGKTDEDYCHFRGIDISFFEKRRSSFIKCLKERREIIWEEEIPRNGNKVFYARMVVPVINNKDEVEYLFGYSFPLSYVKETEIELQKSKERYRRIFQESALPMWIVDLDTLYFIEVNQAAIERYGYSKQEFLRLKLSDIRRDEGGELQSFFADRIARKALRFKDTSLHYLASGEPIHVEFFGIIFEEKGYRYSVSTIVDITQKHRYLEELRSNQEIQKLIMDSSFDAIICINTQGAITSWTLQAQKMLGWDDEEVIGKSLVETLIPPRFHVKFQEEVYHFDPTNHVEASGKELEVIALKKGGDEIIIEFKLVWVNEGANTFFCAYIRDITTQKKVTLELEQNNQDLKKLNEELDRFVYSTSHDLRAPLLSILGLIDLAEDVLNPKGDVEKYFFYIKKSISQMDITIKNILDYSRNMRLGIIPEQIIVEKIIVDYVESIHFIEKEQNIQFMIEVNETIPFHSDKMRFGTIVSNLISNAAKYSRNNIPDPYVRILFTSTEAWGTFIVEDNGEGIPESKISTIFDMFVRNSVTASGSGLGLYICREIIGKMGGKISVTSTPQVGSRFEVVLPNMKTSK